MKNKFRIEKDKIIVNIYFNESGISIKDLLESDYSEFLNIYLKEKEIIH